MNIYIHIYSIHMGVRRIFSRGASRGFSQNFFQGGQKWWIWFSYLKIGKTTIFS